MFYASLQPLLRFSRLIWIEWRNSVFWINDTPFYEYTRVWHHSKYEYEYDTLLYGHVYDTMRYGLVVKASGSEAEGPGLNPDRIDILGKDLYHIFTTGRPIVSYTMTRFGLRKGTFSVHFGQHLLSRVQDKKYIVTWP